MRGRSTGRGCLAIVGFLAMTASARAAEKSAARPFAVDCGPAALYALLVVEGHQVGFDAVVARLPHKPAGHSMKELRDVARSFGVDLDGIYVGEEARAIDRPMLAFLKDDRLRHFLVVRPVGHSGSLVQVIDSNEPPRVIDMSMLVTSSQWTGVVLAPRRRGWSPLLGIGLLVSSGLVGLGLLAARRGRRLASKTTIGAT